MLWENRNNQSSKCYFSYFPTTAWHEVFYYPHQTHSQSTASTLLRAKHAAALPEITEIFNSQNLFFPPPSPAFHFLFCAIFRNPQVYTLQHVKYAFIVFTALLYTSPRCDKLPGAVVDTYTLQLCITSPRRSDTIHHPAAAITACACGKTLSQGVDDSRAEVWK